MAVGRIYKPVKTNMNFYQGWRPSSDYYQGEDTEQLQGLRLDEGGEDGGGGVRPRDLRTSDLITKGF